MDPILAAFGMAQPKKRVDPLRDKVLRDPKRAIEDHWRKKLANQGQLSAYKPTAGERIESGLGSVLAKAVGEQTSQRLAKRAMAPLNDLTPVGDAVAFADGAGHIGRGQYAGGLGNILLGAVGAVPGVGDAAAKGIRGLGSPSTLSLPRTPTVDEMVRASEVAKVPLAQARHGNRLEWDRFNGGDYGEPLVKGYSDKPLAVRLENGEFVLLDGNHRAALSQHNGASDMEMYVIPAKQYDPVNAGRVPTKRPPSDDLDLLAELLGK